MFDNFTIVPYALYITITESGCDSASIELLQFLLLLCKPADIVLYSFFFCGEHASTKG